jgi:hypothetical protein
MRPLVVGSPRSGFALLCSIMSELLPMSPPRLPLRQRLLRAVVAQLQFSISTAVERTFAERGVTADLVYNANFRTVAGGPKWLKPEDPARACIRKYIGVRGKQDFTLVVAHPCEVLETDDIVHSHSHPRLWTELAHYADFIKLASVRNPIGIVNSSLFSINALTSEYIQKFVDPADDDDALRQELALYKFTDLEFFTGIVRHYVAYFDEFLAVADRYHVVRWEDIIGEPAQTISRVAAIAGLAVDAEHAAQIWQRLDHVNLTGAHKHNYRRGKGVVGDWRNWVTNRHLEIIKDHGLERCMERFGYGRIEPLDESRYTDFQRRVADLLSRGEVHPPLRDADLFGFAFNKSNLDSSAFAFKRYGWREHTSIERSCFTDEPLMMAAWDAAEAAAGELNGVLDAVLAGAYDGEAAARRSLQQAMRAAAPIARRMPHAHAALASQLEATVAAAFAPGGGGGAPAVDPQAPPRLIRALGTYNLVSYRGTFSAIPHAAGPLDLQEHPPETVDGALVADSYPRLYAALRRVGAEGGPGTL